MNTTISERRAAADAEVAATTWRVRAALRAAGVSVAAAARACRVSRSTMSRRLAGEAELMVGDLWKIAGLLSVPAASLLAG